uniref:AXH domain-containing protein n=1 Tax=Anopheles melas TaxID=34690 RepID=A0A182UGT4_9DIPT
MFLRGSMISFQNGVKKPVEEVRLEDFLRTAAISPDVRLTEAQTRRITPRYSSGGGDSGPGEPCKKILVRFTYDQQQRYSALETTIDYPFFVTTKGWASYSPDRTFANYGLECARIELGDVFIVLVPRHQSGERQLLLEEEEEEEEVQKEQEDEMPVGYAAGGSKRRPDSQRRGSAKRKLTEQHGLPGSSAGGGNNHHHPTDRKRRTASSDSME